MFQISYVDYYKKIYGIEIKNLTQFLLITKPKKKSFYNSTVQVCIFIQYLIKNNVVIKNVEKKMFTELRYLLFSS